MRGLRIRDLVDDRYLAFDLRDLLAAVGSHVHHSEWQCEVVECVGGEGVVSLQNRYNATQRLSGDALAELADQTHQVIDGVFRAFAPGAKTPWLEIEAVDSTYWEVRTSDEAILDSLGRKFREVERFEEKAVKTV